MSSAKAMRVGVVLRGLAETIPQSEVVAFERAADVGHSWSAGVQDSSRVTEWLVASCGEVQEPVEFHGGIKSASVAVRTGLQVLRNVFVGNLERKRSDIVVQSEWFPRCEGWEPHFSYGPGFD